MAYPRNNIQFDLVTSQPILLADLYTVVLEWCVLYPEYCVMLSDF